LQNKEKKKKRAAEVWIWTHWSRVTEALGLAGDRHSCATLLTNQKSRDTQAFPNYKVIVPPDQAQFN